MKGPYERLKYDLRRVWACPVCQHRERTAGNVTSCLCHCQTKVEPAHRQMMKLVEDGCRRLLPRAVVTIPDDVLPDDALPEDAREPLEASRPTAEPEPPVTPPRAT